MIGNGSRFLRLFSHRPSSLDVSRPAGVSQLRFNLLEHLGSLLEQAKRARQTGFAAELSESHDALATTLALPTTPSERAHANARRQ
jgi:hypothetical protein